MNFSEKAKYMIIGGIIALTGFGIGSLVTNIDAQNEVGVFDTIYTKHIRVSTSLAVGDRKEPNITMVDNEHGGIIKIYDKNYKSCVVLGIDELGGTIHVSPSKGEGGTVLSNSFGPGTLIATSGDNKGGISFSARTGWLLVRGEYGSVSLSGYNFVQGGIVTVTDSNGKEHQLEIKK